MSSDLVMVAARYEAGAGPKELMSSLERRLCMSAQARAAQEVRLATGRIERELTTVRAYLLCGEPPPAAVLHRLAEEAAELVQHGAQWLEAAR